MKILGFAMIFAGFLGGALLASLDPNVVDWWAFAPVVIGGGIGVVIMKHASHAAAKADHVLAGNREVLERSLANITVNLIQLNADKATIETAQMRHEIDRLFRDDLANFADARESLTHLYGLKAYADVMSDFAAGERYLNRVWSASTDGYGQEVSTYLDRALDQFRHAATRLKEVQANA